MADLDMAIQSIIGIQNRIEALSEEKIIKMAAGDKHCAAINWRYELFVWGEPSNGKLGFDSNEDIKRPTKLEDLMKHEIIDVSWGPLHTLIWTKEGKVMSFGDGKYGKLGDGDTDDAVFPTKVIFENQDIKTHRVYAAHSISMAIDIDESRIYTWGNTKYGLLGRENKAKHRTPYSIERFKWK